MGETKREKVAAVVVTYNRKHLLRECLQALLSQTEPLDEIIVIDNASTDGTDEMVPAEFPQVTYVRLPENIGGAGGFHEGMKLAYEKGHDWIWVMDDDAEPIKDALERLAEYFSKENISALACTVKDVNGNISLNHRGFIDFKKIFPLIKNPVPLEVYEKNKILEIDMASFVGLLVKRSAFSKVGYPMKEFFIHHDDVEYCVRLRQVGKLLLVTNSVILHKEEGKSKCIEKKFLFRNSSRVPYEKYWLIYYGIRNLVWLSKKYARAKSKFYIKLFRSYLRCLGGILLFDDKKFRRIHLITNAYIDGLTSNFDNQKAKRILY